jgi:hypothetical protein
LINLNNSDSTKPSQRLAKQQTRRLAKRSNQISNPAINPDLDDDSIGVRSVCDLSIDSKQQAIDPLSSDLG